MLQIVVAHLVMMVPSRLSDTTKKRCDVPFTILTNKMCYIKHI